MEASKSNRALDQAGDFIRESIRSGTWQTGISHLPIKNIADLAKVSAATMFRAISLLREKGTIEYHDSRRDRAKSKIQPSENIPQKLTPWQRKRLDLEKEIFSGRFGLLGRLPHKKELQAQYGVCFRTMEKMLKGLESDGIIKPSGKGYVLPGVSPGRRQNRIVFITVVGHYSQASALNHEHNRMVNMFENECVRLGLRLEIIEADFYNPVESHRVSANLSDDDTILGFILDVWWYGGEEFRRSYIDVLTRLTTFRKPVSILDEIGIFELPFQFSANRFVQVFTIEGKRAAERVARYLLALGHRSIAYISLLHYTEWSRNRFDGIMAQYSRAGYSSGVHLVAGTHDIEFIFPALLTDAGLEDDVVRKLIAVGRTPSQAAHLEKTWLDFKSRNQPPYAGYPHLNSILRNNLAALTPLARQKVDRRFFEKTCKGALETVGDWTFKLSVDRLFQKAIEHRDVTAWVCATDPTAFHALTFLRERKIQVPAHLSVVGFDNIPVKALEQRLTSLDFNAMGFIHRMLNFIIRPPRLRGTYKHAPIEVEGIIMERDTTAKAK